MLTSDPRLYAEWRARDLTGFQGHWKTMSSKSSITVLLKARPKDADVFGSVRPSVLCQ